MPRLDRWRYVLLLVGMLWPFLIVSVVKNYGTIDVGVFHTWSRCWSENWQTVYLNCELRPNYPIVGIFLSSGILAVLHNQFGIAEVAIADQYFRYFLAIFESLNFLLLAYFFQISRLHRPILIAFLIIIMPSTWAGASIWGQIDHVSLTFLLMTLIATLKWWLVLEQTQGKISQPYSTVNGSEPYTRDQIPLSLQAQLSRSIPKQNLIYAIIMPLGITLYILNKQIALFSFPFLLALYAITIAKLSIFQARSRLIQVLTLLLASILIFRGIDSLLITDQPLGSSFIAVWAEGSGHGNMISGNGANLWVFLQRELRSTSHFPLFSIGAYAVKPYTIGIIAYGLFLIYLFQSTIRLIGRVLRTRKSQELGQKSIHLMYICCFFHGISWLGFNVLLTGAHDRHPYIGYSCLLIAIAYYFLNQKLMGPRFVVFSGFVAIAYGIFILGANSELHPILFLFKRNEFIAVWQLIWLVALTEKWHRLNQESPTPQVGFFLES